MRSNAVVIDWLSITSKIHTVTDMMALVGFPDASSWQVGRGMHGYTNRYWRDNISIHYNRQRTVADFLRDGGNGAEDTGGVWLEMSGSGCRAFESLSDGNYDRLFQTVIDNPETMNITRLDVAFDEYDGMLDIDRICSDVAAQKYRGKKLYDTQKTFWEVIQSSNGKSCQVGSPSSVVLVRIYDKLAERLGKIKDPLEQQKIQIVRETGKLDGLAPNVSYGDDFLAGNVVALGISPDADVDFRSLTVDELDLLKICFAISSVDRTSLLTDKE